MTTPSVRLAASSSTRGAVDPSYVESMLERESSVSTYMGNLLAIPHGTNEAKDLIRRSAMSLLRYEEPIDWGGESARFVVGIAGLENEHLEILSKIAIVFSDDEKVDRLLAAGSSDELVAVLSEVNES